MKFVTAFVLLMLSSVHAFGHEMTPTYPKLRPSYIDGLNVITMNLFNRRQDVIYYEIEVYDDDWKQVSFASQEKIIKIDYLGRKDFDVYIREKDSKTVRYVCTTSKLLKSEDTSMITSKICSKIKRE